VSLSQRKRAKSQFGGLVVVST
ncbi:coproporphyrinogen III oxidase family protein, partial [Vibrio parahaemolyticus V-223/04]